MNSFKSSNFSNIRSIIVIRLCDADLLDFHDKINFDSHTNQDVIWIIFYSEICLNIKPNGIYTVKIYHRLLETSIKLRQLIIIIIIIL